MMMKVLAMFMAFASITISLKAEITVEQYIDTYKNIAIEEMEKTGIPASITLAQGILESRFGNSRLAVKGNNHFGIKCHKGWTGKRMYHDDDAKGECFRVYKNPEQSYRDHSEFLQTRSRYEFLFDYKPTDYKNWAHGLKKAGYATNPRYAYLLIDLIERHQLDVYDAPNRAVFASRKHKEKSHTTVSVDAHKEPKVNSTTVVVQDKFDNPNSIQVFSYNRIKTIKVGEKDDLISIARRNQVSVSRLYKYNDMEYGAQVQPGQFIYLQPKRGKAGHSAHKVKEGETLWSISQLYGVKLSKLRARNLLKIGEEPAVGATVNLNKKALNKPALCGYGNSSKQNSTKEFQKATSKVETAMKQAEEKQKKDNLDDTAEQAALAMKKAEEAAKRKEAEEKAKLRAAQQAKWKAEQEAELAKQKASKEAQLKAEQEAARLKAEETTAKKLAEAEAARLKAEQETARLKKELEATKAAQAAQLEAERLVAEEKARAEAEQLRAQQEAAKVKKEQEAEKAKEEAAAKLAAEQEAARERAKEEAAKLKAEQEAARKKAEEAAKQKASEEKSVITQSSQDSKQEMNVSDEEPVAVPRKSAEQIEKDRIDKEKRRHVHKVVKGDTLYGLSKKYNVSVAEIKKWNNLASNALSIGQELEIFRRD